MPSNENRRVEIYDWIRVLGMILVVLGHASYISHATDFGSISYELPYTINGHYQDDIIPNAIRTIGGWAYSFHMPLFFMLSGAVYSLKQAGSFDQIVVKKAKALIIPYFVYGLIFMLPLKYYCDFYKEANMTRVVRNFLEGGAESGHLWFLITLFWCFVLGYILIRYVGKRSMAAVLLIGILLSRMKLEYLPDYLGFKNSLNYLLWFLMGFIFEEYIREKIEQMKTGSQILIFVIMTVVMILLPLDDGNGAIVYIAFHCAWFMLFSLMFMKLSRKLGMKGRIIMFLSPICVYIYIFHDPLEYLILKEAFAYNWLSSGAYVYVYYILRTVGVFVVSALLGMAVYRVKGTIKKKNEEKQ